MHKRQIEGIVGGGGDEKSGKYPKFSVSVKSLPVLGELRPLPGTDLARDEQLQFLFTVPADQMIRFPVEPFSLSYEVMYKNPGHVAKPAQGNDDRTPAQKVEWHFTEAKDKKPAAYLESALAGASFFTHVDVEVNGFPMSDAGPAMGLHGWFYAVFNKTFCSEKLRLEKYNRKIPRVSTENDRKTTNAALSKDLADSMESLSHDSAATSKPKMSDFGFDGVWPFDTQSNQCRELSGGVRNENGYFMPGTTLMFRLWKRTDMTALIQCAAVPETTYYSADVAEPPQFQVNLKDLVLVYEMLELSPDKLDKAKKSPAKYYVDLPRVVFSNVLAGQMVSNLPIQISAGTKFLAVTFVRSEQVFHNSVAKKHLAAHFHHPPNSKKVTFELDGQPLLFTRGIKDVGLSPAASHASRTCRELHKSMVHSNLYSREVEKMFPPEGMSHDQIFVVDLGYREFKVPALVIMEIEYSGDASKDKWLLCAITVQQCLYTLKEREAVKVEILT